MEYAIMDYLHEETVMPSERSRIGRRALGDGSGYAICMCFSRSSNGEAWPRRLIVLL
jgi:hypothetical protein